MSVFALDRFTEVPLLPEDNRGWFGHRVTGAVRRPLESTASRLKEQAHNESGPVEGANCVGSV